MKECSECEIEKSLDSFEKEKKGRRNKCKECRKIDRRAWLDKNKDHCKKYRQDNKAKRAIQIKDWRSTENGKKSGKAATERTNQKYLNAYKSRRYYNHHKHKIDILNNCQKCNEESKLSGHHEDYNKPLDVIFLCVTCHEEWHRTNTPLNRITGIFTEKDK